jgi:AcrR family transcriptional regulator
MTTNANTDPVGAAQAHRDAPPDDGAPITDGRQLRRQRNREAVVEALLDLYRDGNLRPSAEEIAARSGLSPRSLFRYFDHVDDLSRTAMRRQEQRALHLVAVGARLDEPLEHKVGALVDQRFRLFDAVGQAATVARLRAPFQAVLADEVRQNRAFLRAQIARLFAPELAALGARASGVLATADVLTSFESCQLLLHDQGLSIPRAKAAVATALLAVLGPVR